MNTNSGAQRIAQMRQSFIDENLLNDNQLSKWEKLEASSNPKNAHDYVNSYFYDTYQIITSVEAEFDSIRPNYATAETLLHRLQAKCTCVGAWRLKYAVLEMRKCLVDQDQMICKAALASVKEEHDHLTDKLDEYFELKERVYAASGAMQNKCQKAGDGKAEGSSNKRARRE